MVKSISYIQVRMRRQFSTKYGKAEVLLNFWDKMVGVLQETASRCKEKDKKTLNLIKGVMIVPIGIKTTALEFYVKKCEELHAIAFL